MAQYSIGVKPTSEIWCDYPVSDKDNEVASLLLHEDVGKFIALGGGASHLEEAVSRIEKVKSEHSDHPAHLSIMDLESKTKSDKTDKSDKKRSRTKQKKHHRIKNHKNFLVMDK